MKNKKNSNRSFGVLFSLVFLLIAFWPVLKTNNINDLRLWSIAFSAAFLILGVLKSKILTPLHIIWIKFGTFLGKIISPIVLAILFFVVVTPIGLLLKVFKKDILNLEINNTIKTYWIKRNFKILFNKQF
jgi:hypothetical protein|tara:strand:+ start:186 stop:575 length:390 start_codon:yes stop_codon:yes gene_type:complete